MFSFSLWFKNHKTEFLQTVRTRTAKYIYFFYVNVIINLPCLMRTQCFENSGISSDRHTSYCQSVRRDLCGSPLSTDPHSSEDRGWFSQVAMKKFCHENARVRTRVPGWRSLVKASKITNCRAKFRLIWAQLPDATGVHRLTSVPRAH